MAFEEIDQIEGGAEIDGNAGFLTRGDGGDQDAVDGVSAHGGDVTNIARGAGW